MTIDLVPLKEFSDRYARGWRLVPGYDLKSGDYAATMMSPDHKQVWSRSAAMTERNRRKAEVAA